MAIRVRATKIGWFNNELQLVDKEFNVDKEEQLSARWMVRVDGKPIAKKGEKKKDDAPKA
jgi:hypothetical protein